MTVKFDKTDRLIIDALWGTVSAIMIAYIATYAPEAIDILRADVLLPWKALFSVTVLLGLGIYLRHKGD